MEKLKQRKWLTLEQAARHVNEITDGVSVSEIDLIQYAIDGALTLSLQCFSSDVIAMPGILIPPSDAEVRLSSISEVVKFSDIQTRREMRKGKTHVVTDGYLPQDLEEAARAVLLGQDLTRDQQEALNQISQIFPDKPKGHWSFDFAGKRLAGPDYDLVLEIIGPQTFVSGLWDIAPFENGKVILERTWQRANVAPGKRITSPEVAEDETLYLVHPDGMHCAVVDFAHIALSEEQVLCIRPESLEALFEDDDSETAVFHERPKTALEAQKESILKTLIELEFDPTNLPKRPLGRNPGAKAACRDVLLKNKKLFTENSFNDAWKALRQTGEIRGG